MVGSQVIPYCIYINIANCSDSSNDIEDLKIKNMFKTVEYASILLKSIYKKFIPTSEDIKINDDFKKISKNNYEELRKNEYKKYDRVLKNSYAAVANNNQEVVFIHFPFPHPPSIYAQELFNNNNTDLNFDYLLNLKFSDVVLGNILEILNKKSLSQNILLIVSSDHGLRSEIKMRFQPARKIPLIIGISKDKSKHMVNKKISSYHIKDLIGKFLKQEINTNYDIANFFSNSDFVPTTNLNEDLLLKRRNSKLK